jgi:hypothetical protein
MPPVFDLTDHFKTTVEILGRPVPIKVTRYRRAESDELWRRSQELDRRGATPADPAADEAFEAKSLAFFEEVISSSITLEEGVIVDRGESVTTGAGLIEIFYNRQDVLAALAASVIIENRMMPSLAKNSNSLRATGTGSARSTQARSEDASVSTAGSVAPSSSATPSAAMDESDEQPAAAPASSGTASAATAAG